MDSGGGNTGSSDPAKTSTVETATNSLPGCGCSSANNITVRVTPTTGGQFDLQVAKTESVENFKKLISKKLKVPKERICLLHRDRQLREGTLQENQLMDGSRLTLLPSVETGLLAQRPEQSVMQALESLNDTQVNDFLSGKAPLNLTMRLGDHMMLIQLQLSTVTPSSSRRSSGGSSSSSSSTSTTNSSSSSTAAAATSTSSTSASSTSTPAPSSSTASSFSASPSPSPSASPSKSAPFVGGAALPSQLSLAAPSLSSVIAASPSLSSVIAAAAASAASAAVAASASSSGGCGLGGSGSSSSHSHSSGLGDSMMTNSRTAPSPSIPSSSGFAKAPAVGSSPRSSSFTTTTTTAAAATTSSADCAGVHHPATPAPCPAAPAASPHPSPLKFLEEAASFLPKATSSTDSPTASTSSQSFTTSSATSTTTSTSSSSSSSSHASSSSSFHAGQPSTSSPSSSSTTTSSPSSSAAAGAASAPATAAAGSSTHACGYASGASGCKCEAPAAKPMLDTRALAEASRNLTQTLKQLSSEVLTSRSDAAEDSSRGGRRQGAIIESMHHHGKGVYSGTFSGTLNPALQDRYGRPKRDISTIIHILNDLLCATPQYRRHTRQGHSISVEATGSTVPKKGTNTTDKNASSLEYMEESGSLSRENQATRGKMEHLRLIMEERRARRRARREARAAPYTTQWSAKSESLPQSSAMGHDTVEPMETGEQSSSTASSEQQLCELNPPEPVVA